MRKGSEICCFGILSQILPETDTVFRFLEPGDFPGSFTWRENVDSGYTSCKCTRKYRRNAPK